MKKIPEKKITNHMHFFINDYEEVLFLTNIIIIIIIIIIHPAFFYYNLFF